MSFFLKSDFSPTKTEHRLRKFSKIYSECACAGSKLTPRQLQITRAGDTKSNNPGTIHKVLVCTHHSGNFWTPYTNIGQNTQNNVECIFSKMTSSIYKNKIHQEICFDQQNYNSMKSGPATARWCQRTYWWKMGQILNIKKVNICIYLAANCKFIQPAILINLTMPSHHDPKLNTLEAR
jgi:hypothetical protein